MRRLGRFVVTLLTTVDRALALPLLALVWLYRKLLSPALAPACRFVPSCSVYADEALRHHGLTRGTPLTMWRLCRCHPFARGGYDPVPGVSDPIAPPAPVSGITPKDSECIAQ